MSSDDEDYFRIWIGKSHVEPKSGRINNVAPAAYALSIKGRQVDEDHWGFGGEKSTEAMFAHGLIHGLSIALRECEHPRIDVITNKLGTEKYLSEFVLKWMSDLAAGKRLSTKDNLATWKEALALSEIGRLKLRPPECAFEIAKLDYIQALSRVAAQKAFERFLNDRSLFKTPGIIETRPRSPLAEAAE